MEKPIIETKSENWLVYSHSIIPRILEIAKKVDDGPSTPILNIGSGYFTLKRMSEIHDPTYFPTEITIDPEPNKYIESIQCQYIPDYPVVNDEVIKKYYGKCNLFISWPLNDPYDIEAIEKLNPHFVIVLINPYHPSVGSPGLHKYIAHAFEKKYVIECNIFQGSRENIKFPEEYHLLWIRHINA